MSAVQLRLAQARELVRKRAAEKAKSEAAESAAAGSDDLDETTVKDDEDEVDADLDGLSDDLDATEMEDEEVPPDEEEEEEEPPPPPPADDDDDDNDEDLPPSDDDEDLPPSDDEEVPPSDDDEPPPSDDAEEKSLVIEDEEIDDEDLPPSDDDEAPSSTSSSSRGGKKKKSTMHHDLHDEASRRAVRMDARKAKRLAAEMQDVTFQPSTNKGKRKGTKGAGGATKSGSSGSAHRRLHNPRSVQEKAERAAKAREREAKRDCSFNPVISAKARARKSVYGLAGGCRVDSAITRAVRAGRERDADEAWSITDLNSPSGSLAQARVANGALHPLNEFAPQSATGAGFATAPPLLACGGDGSAVGESVAKAMATPTL
jgi:hypothetical protein